MSACSTTGPRGERRRRRGTAEWEIARPPRGERAQKCRVQSIEVERADQSRRGAYGAYGAAVGRVLRVSAESRGEEEEEEEEEAQNTYPLHHGWTLLGLRSLRGNLLHGRDDTSRPSFLRARLGPSW
jgi:hypothetical protein